MLTQILFFHTGHFSLTVLMAFTFFASGLLYLDSWQIEKRRLSPVLRSIGFFVLSFATAFHATDIDIPTMQLGLELLKVSGLALILISLMMEPVLGTPESMQRSIQNGAALSIPSLLPVLPYAIMPLSAVLALLIAAWYLRKATQGLERQLWPAALAFMFFGAAASLSVAFFWADTSNVFWSKILAEYSLVWSIQHVLEGVGTLILGVWIWGYIRFRLQIQLFVTITASVLSVFLVTTFFFTFLLLRNLENDAMSHLETDVSVLQYALNRLQLEALANAKAVAQDTSFNEALEESDSQALSKITADFMFSQGTHFLTVASSSGEVLMRGEDRLRVGDNIAEESVAKSALAGQPLSTIVSKDGVSAPTVFVEAATPIKGGGTVVTGFIIDSAFVDGVKDITSLDVTVFGGNKRAATTFVAPDGKSRFVGTLETNEQILETVLSKGESYVGAANVFNQPYYTAYSPLMTLGDKPVGMLFVGKPQTTLMQAAQRSIELTFIGSVILMTAAIIPAYFLARFMNEQIRA